MGSERLPSWLAWIFWAIAAIVYLIGAAIGAILSDAYGSTILTWRNKRKGQVVAEKTYRPKSGNEGLAVEAAIERVPNGVDSEGEPTYARAEGEPFSVSSWPYTTSDPAEQNYLDTLDALTDQAAPAPRKSSSTNGGGS